MVLERWTNLSFWVILNGVRESAQPAFKRANHPVPPVGGASGLWVSAYCHRPFGPHTTKVRALFALLPVRQTTFHRVLYSELWTPAERRSCPFTSWSTFQPSSTVTSSSDLNSLNMNASGRKKSVPQKESVLTSHPRGATSGKKPAEVGRASD